MKKDYSYVLNQFAQNVRAGRSEFVVKHGDTEYYSHFICTKIGNAVFYYVSDGYENDFYFEKDVQYKLCAICVNQKIYVLDYYEFYMFNKLPEGTDGDDVILFDDYCRELNAALRAAIAEYYERLEANEQISTNPITVRDGARQHLILGYDYAKECRKFNITFSICDVKKILAFGYDLDAEINRVIDANKESLSIRKCYETKIKKLVESGTIADEWEIRLSKTRETKAEFVTIEFEYNGKTAAAKMKLETLLRYLNNGDYLSSYSFKTNKEGKELFKTLNASDWNSRLYCKDISRVLFRGKPIYERSTNNAS